MLTQKIGRQKQAQNLSGIRRAINKNHFEIHFSIENNF